MMEAQILQDGFAMSMQRIMDGFLRAHILSVAVNSPVKDGLSCLFRLFLNNEITFRQFVGITRDLLRIQFKIITS